MKRLASFLTWPSVQAKARNRWRYGQSLVANVRVYKVKRVPLGVDPRQQDLQHEISSRNLQRGRQETLVGQLTEEIWIEVQAPSVGSWLRQELPGVCQHVAPRPNERLVQKVWDLPAEGCLEVPLSSVLEWLPRLVLLAEVCKRQRQVLELRRCVLFAAVLLATVLLTGSATHGSKDATHPLRTN